MIYLIGTDEAGYGPNLGPLVVSATVWQVPDDVTHTNLYRALEDCITPLPKHLPKAKKSKTKKGAKKKAATKKSPRKTSRKIRVDDRVWIADSKQLYKPSGGGRSLAALERGVLAAIGASGGDDLSDWHDLWKSLCGDDHDSMKQLPWYSDFDECLPIEVTTDAAILATERLTTGLEAANIRLCRIRSRVIDASQFNELLGVYENKSEVLSHVTLGLAADQMKWIHATDNDPAPIQVLCDKHGGRNRYAALLSHHFPDHFVEVSNESRPVSVYAFGPAEARIEFRFQAKADNILAAGLASMTSKYLRELAMRAFNDFWRGHDAELRPTAGYPGDARRFKKQIATVQANLGIADHTLWRDR